MACCSASARAARPPRPPPRPGPARRPAPVPELAGDAAIVLFQKAAAYEAAHPHRQDLAVGLRHNVIGTRREGGYQEALVGLGPGHADQRKAEAARLDLLQAARTDLGAEGDPVIGAADEVERHAIEARPRRVEGRQRRRAVGGGDHGVALLREQAGEEGAVGGAAIDDQHAAPAEGRAGGALRRAVLALAQQGADAQHQEIAIGRLLDIGVGAALEAVALAVAGARQHHHRQRAGAQRQAHLPRELVAVHAGQVMVGDHQIRQIGVEEIEGGFRGRAALDREALGFELEPQFQRLRFRILHQQQAVLPRRRFGGSCTHRCVHAGLRCASRSRWGAT